MSTKLLAEVRKEVNQSQEDLNESSTSGWIITGYSQKTDGFIFYSGASNREAALQELITALNKDSGESWHVLSCNTAEVVTTTDVEDIDDIYDEEQGVGWGGWDISAGQVNKLGFAQDAVCW